MLPPSSAAAPLLLPTGTTRPKVHGPHVGGLEQFDLEDDAAAFEVVLPRVRVIPIDQFDPARFL